MGQVLRGDLRGLVMFHELSDGYTGVFVCEDV